MTHNELKGDVDYDLEILLIAGQFSLSWFDIGEHLRENMLNIGGSFILTNVKNHFFLSVQNDISELTEILNN